MTTIPRVLFQTNRLPNERYVTEQIQSKLSPEWKYEFYSDDDVIAFFKSHPIVGLHHIVEKYNRMEKGAHKADLFRYYYLYVNGGVFMDSDAMIYENIDDIVQNYDFFSVKSTVFPDTIFQGILGASPKNEIVKHALYHAYSIDPHMLAYDYHCLCRELYKFVCSDTNGYRICLYNESRTSDYYDDILDNKKTILFKHFWRYKRIPVYNHTKWNHYQKRELNTFDYRALTVHHIPNPLIRVGPREDGGYVIADGVDYDFFLSCGIANDIRFEECLLDKYSQLQCYAFDGTIDTFMHTDRNITWIKKNIGYENNETTTNLEDYMKDYDKIFLKMDIEGSEFNWLESLSNETLQRFSQIVMEVHWPFDKYRSQMLAKLNETHYIVHIHGNNYCDRDIPPHLPSGRTYDGTVTICHSELPKIRLPEVFEITYVNKQLVDGASVYKEEVRFPTHLDSPNNPFAEDIEFSIPIESRHCKSRHL